MEQKEDTDVFPSDTTHTKEKFLRFLFKGDVIWMFLRSLELS